MATQVSPIISSSPTPRKVGPPERKYKCQFCSRAFSRSEHRSRHERSHTKERPFQCTKCRSSFVRRDLLLRHDRTVHKDGVPLSSSGKRRGQKTGQSLSAVATPVASSSSIRAPPTPTSVEATLHDLADESTDEMPEVAAATMLASLQQNHHRDSDDNASPHRPSFNRSFSAMTSNSSQGFSSSHLWDHPPPPSSPAVHSAGPSSSFGYPSHEPSQLSHPPHLHPSRSDQIPTPVLSIASLSGSMLPPPHASPMLRRASPVPSQPPVHHIPRFGSPEQVLAIIEATRDIGGSACEPYCQLPSIDSLNRYLEAYFVHFHHHMPFLHPSSFIPSYAAPPLLFAVLSIGALYVHHHDYASWFHLGAQELVRTFVDNKEKFSSRQCPLWSLQATMLNMVYASWSGSSDGLEWACSIKGLLSNMVCGDIYRLKLRVEARGDALPTRSEWLEDEACRRTYYSVYILFGMLTVAYNHTPGIRFDDFVDLPLPSFESLWNQEPVSEDAWKRSLRDAGIISFGEANDRLFQGQSTRFSIFGTRVMVTALFLEVWSHKRRPEGLQDVATEYKLRRGLETWEQSLKFCEPSMMGNNGNDNSSQCHPLIFNGRAMARAAKVRLSVDLKNVQEALRYHNDNEVAAAMSKSRDRVVRSAPDMLSVIQECCDSLEVVLQRGVRWVARNLATCWSIEYPLCSMELMVILTQWLSRLELDEQAPSEGEREMYTKLRNFFDEESIQKYGGHLSWLVANLWGSLIDEVVVWGISKSMGRAFQQYAGALTAFHEPGRQPAPCSGVSQNVRVLGMQAAY